jgi:hypothetical protein
MLLAVYLVGWRMEKPPGDIVIIIHTYNIILYCHVPYFLRPYTSALKAWQWKWNGAPEPAQGS